MTSFFKGCYGDLIDHAEHDMGEFVEYRPKRGGRYKFKAIFDQNFEQIDPDTQVVISVNQPRIEVDLEDIPNQMPQQDDIVILYNTDRLKEETYKVNEIQEDGLGAAVLFLTLQDNE